MVEQAQSKTVAEVSATDVKSTEKPERKSEGVKKRFGSEIDVEDLTGIKRHIAGPDRFFKRNRFPYYKVSGRVLYDLDEVETIIRASRLGGEVEQA